MVSKFPNCYMQTEPLQNRSVAANLVYTETFNLLEAYRKQKFWYWDSLVQSGFRPSVEDSFVHKYCLLHIQQKESISKWCYITNVRLFHQYYNEVENVAVGEWENTIE